MNSRSWRELLGRNIFGFKERLRGKYAGGSSGGSEN